MIGQRLRERRIDLEPGHLDLRAVALRVGLLLQQHLRGGERDQRREERGADVEMTFHVNLATA